MCVIDGYPVVCLTCAALVSQFANATIGWYEITKADNAVAALKATLKPVATAKRNGTWQQIDGALLVPGDCVLLGSGSAVPADCKVGTIENDTVAFNIRCLTITIKQTVGSFHSFLV